MIIGLYMGCIGVVKGLWKTKWKLLYDNRVICGLYRGNKGIMENKNGNYYMIIGLYMGCIGVIMGLWKINGNYHMKYTYIYIPCEIHLQALQLLLQGLVFLLHPFLKVKPLGFRV